MKKFLFKIACKLIGYKEIYSYKTDANFVLIASEKPLSKKQLRELDSSITNGKEIQALQSVLPGDISGVVAEKVVSIPIRKSLVELATKVKKETGIIQEGNLILEEK